MTSENSAHKDAEVSVTKDGERTSGSSLNLELPIRRSPKVSNAPETKSSDGITQELVSDGKDQQQTKENDAKRSPRPLNSGLVRQESTVEASKPLARIPIHTHIRLGREEASQSPRNQLQKSQRQDELGQESARGIEGADTVVAPIIPTSPLHHRKHTNFQHSPTKSAHSAKANVKDPDSPLSRRWPHHLAEAPAHPSSHKRPSSTHIDSRSSNENKKARLEKQGSLGINKEDEELIEEEIRRAKRARRMSERGDHHGATAEYQEIHKIRDRRNSIKTRVHGRTSWQPTGPGSKAGPERQRDTRAGPWKVTDLPRNSPLNNVIHSAGVVEEAVQTRLKFRVVEGQLTQEKARYGSASPKVVSELHALNDKLAALNRQRAEIKQDAHRMDAFRRGDNVPPRTLAVPPTADDWKDRLTLCYEVVNRSAEPWHVKMENANSESGMASAEEAAVVQQRVAGENERLKVGGAKGRNPAMRPPRQLRFALTGIETLL